MSVTQKALTQRSAKLGIAKLKNDVYEFGIASIEGAFSRQWAQQLHRDYEPLMREAQSRAGGTMSRGHNRFHHEVYPERLSGFLDVIKHPAFTGLCEAVLGPDYKVVECAFDVPLPGAQDQPWHRDFPIGSETLIGRWLSSLDFSITTVDVTADMGALEIAPGTHFDDGKDFSHGMFPAPETYGKYKQFHRRFESKLGDMFCRTGLTIHRGTHHNASIARPVLIVGVMAKLLADAHPKKLTMTRAFYESLPATIKPRLAVKLTDGFEVIDHGRDSEDLRY